MEQSLTMTDVFLTREALDAAAIGAALRSAESGAVIVFEGVVRAEQAPDGRALAALDYSAYEDMALEQLAILRDRALRGFAIRRATLAHRLGRMKLGETSVVVAVCAAHRDAAFEACRWLIDNIKSDVPIWKKDIWSDGAASWTPVA